MSFILTDCSHVCSHVQRVHTHTHQLPPVCFVWDALYEICRCGNLLCMIDVCRN